MTVDKKAVDKKAIHAKHAATRLFLGERLELYRKDADISVEKLAEKVGYGRQYLYLVKSGDANFAINLFLEALSVCGVPWEEFLRAIQTSDIPEAHRPAHAMLSDILQSEIKELVDGFTVNLVAMHEKVERLKRQRKPRPNPNPKGTSSAPSKRRAKS